MIYNQRTQRSVPFRNTPFCFPFFHFKVYERILEYIKSLLEVTYYGIKIRQKNFSLFFRRMPRYPLKYLAQKVFLSSPAVSTRIERLENAGILTGYHATIDPVALGYHITAFINLTLDPNKNDEFYPYVKDCPNVLECNCVTGTYSIMLKVAFPSTMELDTFIGHLQRFGNTQTQIVFSTAVPPRGVGIATDDLEKE